MRIMTPREGEVKRLYFSSRIIIIMSRLHRICCLPVLLALLATPVLADEARLLADLAPGTFLSFDFPQYIREFTRVGNRSVFLRNENESLQALWVTDGTVQGTKSLGIIGSWLEQVVPLGSTAGIAFYGVGYEETVIWRTDGTPGGTFPVAAGLRQPGGFGQTIGAVSGGLLYFRACSPELGCEVWVSDGSEAGTAPVGEIAPGPESGDIREIASIGGRAFVIANDAVWIAYRQSIRRLRETPEASRLAVHLVRGKPRAVFFARSANGSFEVWSSDGSVAGTRPVTSFNPPDPFPRKTFLALFSGRAWFTADDGVNGVELWSVGDRPGSQTRHTNLRPGLTIAEVGKAGDRIVLVVANPVGVRRIWTTRGPLTRCPGGCPALLGPLASLDAGRFVLYGANQQGAGFWITDGTPKGTRRLRRSEPRVSAEAVSVGGRVLFRLADESIGREIWITDGTSAGTFQITTSDLDSFTAGVANGAVVFSGTGETEEDWPISQVLWRSDGTPAGSFPLTEAPIPRSSAPRLLTPFRGDLLVQACPHEYDVTWRELWFVRTSGESTRLNRWFPPRCDVYPPVLLEKGAVGITFGFGDAELWRTDGTLAGTAVLHRDASEPFRFGNEAAFWVGSELWLTDGTPEGTRKHLELPARATWLAGRFWFFLDSRLWVSNGTPAGTIPLTPVGEVSFRPFFTEAGGRVYFPFEGEIWSTDGTPAGTRPAITAASGALSPERLSVAQGRLYFAAPRIDDPTGPRLPWTSDGTDAGTVLLAEGIDLLDPSFVEFDGRVFFSAWDPRHGDELWSTSGTPEDTALFLEIAPGLLGAEPRELTVWKGRLWFRARDAEHGMELWTSDGTAEGTRLFQDIAPGASWSSPAHFAPADEGLYFSADDGTHGREVWMLPAGF